MAIVEGTLNSVDPRTWDLGTTDLGARAPRIQDPNWHEPYMYIWGSLNAQLEYVDWSSGTAIECLKKCLTSFSVAIPGSLFT